MVGSIRASSNLRTQSAKGVRLAAMELRKGCATRSASKPNVGLKTGFINGLEMDPHHKRALHEKKFLGEGQFFVVRTVWSGR